MVTFTKFTFVTENQRFVKLFDIPANFRFKIQFKWLTYYDEKATTLLDTQVPISHIYLPVLQKNTCTGMCRLSSKHTGDKHISHKKGHKQQALSLQCN